jgi:hypothetical protein
MKITTLTADELELKEGGTTGIIVGAGLIVGGIVSARCCEARVLLRSGSALLWPWLAC